MSRITKGGLEKIGSILKGLGDNKSNKTLQSREEKMAQQLRDLEAYEQDGQRLAEINAALAKNLNLNFRKESL